MRIWRSLAKKSAKQSAPLAVPSTGSVYVTPITLVEIHWIQLAVKKLRLLQSDQELGRLTWASDIQSPISALIAELRPKISMSKVEHV